MMKHGIVISLICTLAVFGCKSLNQRLASLDENVRMQAERELYQTAHNSGCCPEELAVVSRISCQELLGEIVISNSNVEVVAAAVDKIKDQDILFRVSRLTRDVNKLMLVYEKMDDETLSVSFIPYTDLIKKWNLFRQERILVKVVPELDRVDEHDWELLLSKIPNSIYAKDIQMGLGRVYSRCYRRLTASARKFIVDRIVDIDIVDEMIAYPRDRIKHDRDKRMEQIAHLRKKLSESAGVKLKAKRREIVAELSALYKTPSMRLYVSELEGRSPLYSKMNDDYLVSLLSEKMKEAKSCTCAEKIELWEDLNCLVSAMKSAEAKSESYRLMLATISKNHKGASVDASAQMVVDAWHMEKQKKILFELLKRNAIGGEYIVKYASEAQLIKMIKGGVITSDALVEQSVRRISSEMLDRELYEAIPNYKIRELMKSRMPTSMLANCTAVDAAEVKCLLDKAIKSSAFSLKGFYVGMPIADAMRLAVHYLPGADVVLTKNNEIEIDVVHSKDCDDTPMFFCQADKEGIVYRINFDKERFLNKWFAYDVQDYREWADEFGREFKFGFRRKDVNGKRDHGRVWLSVTQEAYYYNDNSRACRVMYFGEKNVFDPNGEITLHSISSASGFDGAAEAFYTAGLIEGVRSWVKNGWENSDGAREGTLRLQRLN